MIVIKGVFFRIILYKAKQRKSFFFMEWKRIEELKKEEWERNIQKMRKKIYK